MKKFALAVATALLATAATFAPAETVEEALDRIHTAMQSQTSTMMKTRTVVKSEMMEMESVSTAWTEKSGETWKMRVEMEGTQKMKMPGQDGTPQVQEMKNKTLSVSDGAVMYTESEMMGQKQVMKMKAQSPDTALKQMKDMLGAAKGEVLADEAINGENCTVIQFAMGEGPAATTSKMWLSEKTGAMMKMEAEAPGGAGKTTMTVEEYNAGEDIDDAKFQYTPPAGVQVMDMSAMAQ